MNAFPNQLEQQLRDVTSRTASSTLSAEDRELQAAFLRFGNLLEQESQTFKSTKLQITITPVEAEKFSWWGMLSLAASLLVMASVAASFTGKTMDMPHSFARNLPLNKAHQPAWEDDWDVRYESVEHSLSAARLNRLNSTDAATNWLDAALRRVQGEIAAESM